MVTDTRRYRVRRQGYRPAIPFDCAAELEACGSALCSGAMEGGLKEKQHIAACPPGMRVVPKEEVRGTNHSQ